MKLAKWRDEFSDGCSVPWWIKWVFPDSEETCQCCIQHDKAYYYGGSREDRRKADLACFKCWLDTMHPARAFARWVAIRLGGHPMLKQKGVSWGFGGEVFKYTEE